MAKAPVTSADANADAAKAVYILSLVATFIVFFAVAFLVGLIVGFDDTRSNATIASKIANKSRIVLVRGQYAIQFKTSPHDATTFDVRTEKIHFKDAEQVVNLDDKNNPDIDFTFRPPHEVLVDLFGAGSAITAAAIVSNGRALGEIFTSDEGRVRAKENVGYLIAGLLGIVSGYSLGESEGEKLGTRYFPINENGRTFVRALNSKEVWKRVETIDYVTMVKQVPGIRQNLDTNRRVVAELTPALEELSSIDQEFPCDLSKSTSDDKNPEFFDAVSTVARDFDGAGPAERDSGNKYKDKRYNWIWDGYNIVDPLCRSVDDDDFNFTSSGTMTGDDFARVAAITRTGYALEYFDGLTYLLLAYRDFKHA